MKLICLGGILIGFTRASNAAQTKELKAMVEDNESVVLVCHGAPYESGDQNQTGSLPSALLELDLHALLLAHRDHGRSIPQLNELQKQLAPTCKRVFGMTRGWDTIDAGQRAKVISFLESNESAPADSDVQTLLGYDSPVSRLALRVALEIALRDLEGGIPQTALATELSANALLAPALLVAEQEPALTEVVTGIREALASDPESLQKQVSRALVELRS
jgi:hypothetical protein